MIEAIRIDNFKSLSGGTTIQLSGFNCFVGINGAGKSTILQALDFISQQMHGDISGWLDSRGWNAKDLYNMNQKKHTKIISFDVAYRFGDGTQLIWQGKFNRDFLRCTFERFFLRVDGSGQLLIRADNEGENPTLMRADGGKLYQSPGQVSTLTQEYQGSVLSGLMDRLILSEKVKEFRDALKNMRSLELLSPILLRKSSRSQDKDIGVNGEKLSGYLDAIKGEHREDLLTLLRKFYPRVVDFRVKTSKGGWKRLFVQEQFENATPFGVERLDMETEAAHLNDGLLRILAVLAQTSSAKSTFILLDEIENGINPEIIEQLMTLLVETKAQIVVTTHSPMILNYLNDDVAKEAVLFVYKSPAGLTRVRKFFAIPRIADKLEYMGAGEAFVDTDLNALTDICVGLDASAVA